MPVLLLCCLWNESAACLYLEIVLAQMSLHCLVLILRSLSSLFSNMLRVEAVTDFIFWFLLQLSKSAKHLASDFDL